MTPIKDAKPIALEYSRQPAPKSAWPVGVYTWALVWATVTMRWYTAATTSYRDENLAQLRTQLPLLACAALRLAWARYRGEQGRGWIFYVALLLGAPVLWAVASPYLGSLGRTLWGGPLIP
jgi:hypothetical protein